jgi:hypothetical protein
VISKNNRETSTSVDWSEVVQLNLRVYEAAMAGSTKHPLSSLALATDSLA